MRDYEAEMREANRIGWEAGERARAIATEAFAATIPDRIRDEQAKVDAHLAAGMRLVINRHGSGSGELPLVHDASCFSVRDRVDRAEAWKHYHPDPRGSSAASSMPEFVTEADLRDERRYRTCRNCQPMVAEPAKNVRPPRPATKLLSINHRHIGRDFETVDGSPLGELVSFTVSADGVSLQFRHGQVTSAEVGAVRMLALPQGLQLLRLDAGSAGRARRAASSRIRPPVGARCPPESQRVTVQRRSIHRRPNAPCGGEGLMAHVREVTRKAGRAFEVRWRDGGKERQRTFTVKREAERFALKVENAKSDGTGTHDLTRTRQTFAEVAAGSLAASRSTLKPTTLAGYELLHSARLVPAFGRQRISAITSQAVEDWVAQLLADGLAASTVRNHFVALNKVFRYAVRHRLISVNPCDAIDVPRPGNASTFAPVFLTPAQVEAVADALDAAAPYGLLVRFAAQTGLCAAEIAGLRVRDVNLAAWQVEVRQTVKKVGTAWVVNTPKSARSTRDVPIFTAALLAALREHLLTHPSSGDPDALFWPGRRASAHSIGRGQSTAG